jgi:Replication factor A protein 3
MDFQQQPRVNGQSMSQFLGRNVILIGEVLSSHAGQNQAIIKAPDGVSVTAYLPPGEVCGEQFVQLVGKVEQGNVLSVVRVMPIQGDFNLDMYNKAVELANGKCKELFM